MAQKEIVDFIQIIHFEEADQLLRELAGEMLETWVLPHCELGKIYKKMGDAQMAKEYYGKFLSIWKDADTDIPTLKQAKAECSKLQ